MSSLALRNGNHAGQSTRPSSCSSFTFVSRVKAQYEANRGAEKLDEVTALLDKLSIDLREKSLSLQRK